MGLQVNAVAISGTVFVIIVFPHELITQACAEIIIGPPELTPQAAVETVFLGPIAGRPLGFVVRYAALERDWTVKRPGFRKIERNVLPELSDLQTKIELFPLAPEIGD